MLNIKHDLVGLEMMDKVVEEMWAGFFQRAVDAVNATLAAPITLRSTQAHIASFERKDHAVILAEALRAAGAEVGPITEHVSTLDHCTVWLIGVHAVREYK